MSAGEVGTRPLRLDPRPVYSPETALGWRDVALDGLNCVLRCVEAALAYQGLRPLEVARALGGAPDFLMRDYALRFPACHLEWREKDDGRANWARLHDWLAAGHPVVVMPDRFFWPGDEFEGKRHFHDHAVLVFASDGSRLCFLDTDAPPDDEYVGSHEISEQVMSACTRVARVHLDTARLDRSDPDTYAAREAVATRAALARDIPALRRFFGLLDIDLHSDVARGLHILVLGQIQPGLFLFGRSLDGVTTTEHREIRARALTAAGNAKRLGLNLIAAHRYGTARVYRAAMCAHRDLLASLCSLGEVLGIPPDAPPEAADVLRWLERLRSVISWCYTSLDFAGSSSRELANNQVAAISRELT
jgi:hypothetical protein